MLHDWRKITSEELGNPTAVYPDTHTRWLGRVTPEYEWSIKHRLASIGHQAIFSPYANVNNNDFLRARHFFESFGIVHGTSNQVAA